MPAQEGECAALRADLLALCGRRQEAAEVLAARLHADPDNWTMLLGYLDCQLPATATQRDAHGGAGALPLHVSSLLLLEGGLAQHLGAAAAGGGGAAAAASEEGEPAEEALAQARALVEELCAAVRPLPAPGGPRRECMRGPHLAKVRACAALGARTYTRKHKQSPGFSPRSSNPVSRDARLQVELALRETQLGLPGSPPRLLAERMLAYVQEAGHLVSCAADLRPFTRRLPPDQAAWLAQQLQEQGLLDHSGGGGGEGGAALTAAEVRRRVCALQLGADMDQPPLASVGQAVRYAVQLMGLYRDSQHLYQVR